MDVITVSGLTKQYGPLWAVKDISFRVGRGSVFGILGPNGAGKTTTVECLAGLRSRSGGTIEILGLDPELHRQKLFGKVGIQLQETIFQNGARVEELCELFSSMYPSPLNYHRLLEQFGLGQKSRSFLSQLSGGQRQKVALILALIGDPEILFLDELTTGLDPRSRREIWAYIQHLKNEGRTIVLTTHYMEEAAELCDLVCLIKEGQIVACDTVDGVIAQAQLNLMITLETSWDPQALERALPSIQSVQKSGKMLTIYTNQEETVSDLILHLREREVSFRRLRIVYPELEDAFLKLVEVDPKGDVS